jgi:hypothetical protein
VAAAVLSAALATAMGCGGSGGNNDQGIVFRATGMFRGLENIDETEITCTEPSIETAIVDLSWELRLSMRAFPDRNDPFADPCGGYIALQNNLTQLNINVQRINIRYEVPGASIPIPDQPIPAGPTIPPASSPVVLPSGLPNLLYVQLNEQLVPNVIMVFLNQNVDRLPATPYFMTAFVSATGISDTGEEYTTNEVGYDFTVVP